MFFLSLPPQIYFTGLLHEKWSNWLASLNKSSKIHQISEMKGQCVYFMGLHLKIIYHRRRIGNIIMTDGRRGSDVTQLHLQHTKKCLLVSPDQLQTIYFLNRQNFNKEKITLSLLNIIMLPQYLMVSMTYQIGSKLCN